MTLYRKFGQFLAALVCFVMFVLCVVFVFTNGVSNVDSETGNVIYFYELGKFQGYLFVALAFLISVVVNVCAVDLPQVASLTALLPLVMSFYQMAVGNLYAVVAAIILLLALIHLACNVLAWLDARAVKAKKAAAVASKEKTGESA